MNTQVKATPGTERPQHEVVVVGAGVSGIYQLYRLVQLGVNVTVLEAAGDLGGTWYRNRYPGCRFDSESYTYGYSFSKELLAEWDWPERFSAQPDTLRYLNHVAKKFDLRKHMQFDCKIEQAVFDEANNLWRLKLGNGRTVTTRFVVTGIGLLSAPTMPRIAGIESFKGPCFHTYFWPHEPVELAGKRVAVIGTGATGVQVISAIADQVGSLTVFQRRPNWCAPLNNSKLSPQDMAEIKSRYDQIFAKCLQTPGGFEHEPDRRGFYQVSREQRVALWDKLYGEPGFGIWLSNFREIFTDEVANAEFSEYVAERIRQRVKDPLLAEQLVPKDHGFGVQRVPLETRYYEAFNLPTTHLVNIQETPIECITPTGVRTSEREYEFDLIVFATGFDAITGSYDRIDIQGVGGQKLRDKWHDGPVTFLGMQVNGFPNFITIAGPQSGSASTNFPRGIETGVDWVTKLLQYMWQHDYTRVDATPEAEERWTNHVAKMYSTMLMRKAKGWFTGYNSNVDGHEHGRVRHLVYNGGAPKFVATISQVAEENYKGMSFE